MNQNDGAQEFGIFQDEFPDATNEELTKDKKLQPVFIKRDLDPTFRS